MPRPGQQGRQLVAGGVDCSSEARTKDLEDLEDLPTSLGHSHWVILGVLLLPLLLRLLLLLLLLLLRLLLLLLQLHLGQNIPAPWFAYVRIVS